MKCNIKRHPNKYLNKLQTHNVSEHDVFISCPLVLTTTKQLHDPLPADEGPGENCFIMYQHESLFLYGLCV